MMDVVLPQLGMSMTEADLIEWLVAVGDQVEEGQELVRIETAKVEDTVNAPAKGVVAEIVAPAGETVPVGGILARIAAG